MILNLRCHQTRKAGAMAVRRRQSDDSVGHKCRHNEIVWMQQATNATTTNHTMVAAGSM